MNLHEYQGKELFARYGLPVLPGQVAGSPEEARDIAASLGGTVVIKAQVQAGGRGKAGGVKLAHDPEEAFARAADILALTIKGLPVRKVLVAKAADIAREYYCAIVMDRERKAPPRPRSSCASTSRWRGCARTWRAISCVRCSPMPRRRRRRPTSCCASTASTATATARWRRSTPWP
jgi:hypothetical protein